MTRTLPTANRKVFLHSKNQNIDFVFSKTAILYPQWGSFVSSNYLQSETHKGF